MTKMTDAQKALVFQWTDLVHHLVNRRYPWITLRRDDLYDDAVQEGMLHLVQAAIHWREGGAQFNTYAHIAISRGLSAWAKKRVGRGIHVPADKWCDCAFTSLDCDMPAKDRRMDERIEEDAEELLSVLPDRHRTVIRRRFSGETLIDIGADLGISKERVRQIAKSGMRRMKESVGVEA